MKTPRYRQIEKRTGVSRRELLEDQERRRVSPEAGAAEFGVHRRTYDRYLEEEGGRVITTISLPKGR